MGPQGKQGPPGPSACPTTTGSPAGLFSLGSLPWWAWVLDLAILAVVVVYVVGTWLSWRTDPVRAATLAGGTPARATRTLEDMARAVASMGNFRSVNVAGASLLLAAIGVLLGFHSSCQSTPHSAFTQLTIGAIWLVSSLLAGVISGGYELNHIHVTGRSIAENPLVMTAASGQMGALLAGGALFVSSLFLL